MLVFFFLPFGFARAQVDAGSFGDNLSLSASPQYSHPGDIVHVSLQGVSSGFDPSSITWYVGPKKLTQATAASAIDIVAPALGAETSVTAQVAGGGSANIVIRPSELDLLWESDSYVPLSYRGRALPSAGSMIRLEAEPRFKRANGAMVANKNIIFTWRRGPLVMQSVSGLGKSSVSVAAPTLFGTDTISVEAHSADGTIGNTATVRIASVEPKLVMYQDDPLTGVSYFKAFGANEDIQDAEVTLQAVPYYLAGSPKDAALQYDWSLNGGIVRTNTAHPDEITVNAAGADGIIAQIHLALTSASDMFLSAAGDWNVSFSHAGTSGGANPFTAK